jgi:hypothetical protein
MIWHHTYFLQYAKRGNKALKYQIERCMHYTVYSLSSTRQGNWKKTVDGRIVCCILAEIPSPFPEIFKAYTKTYFRIGRRLGCLGIFICLELVLLPYSSLHINGEAGGINTFYRYVSDISQ